MLASVMRAYQCQECGLGISRYCRKCPRCCARNPTAPRLSPLAIVAAVILLGGVVFVIKNLHVDDGAARPIHSVGWHEAH